MCGWEGEGGRGKGWGGGGGRDSIKCESKTKNKQHKMKTTSRKALISVREVESARKLRRVLNVCVGNTVTAFGPKELVLYMGSEGSGLEAWMKSHKSEVAM